jgi:hypothetical protein
MGIDPDTIRKYYESHNLMDNISQVILKEKTLKYLVENAKIKNVSEERT